MTLEEEKVNCKKIKNIFTVERKGKELKIDLRVRSLHYCLDLK